MSSGSDESEGEQESYNSREATLIEELSQEIAKAKEEVLYSRAEAENARRRFEKEISDVRRYASSALAKDILSVSDNLDRALKSTEGREAREIDWAKLVEGLQATRRELARALANNGITAIDAVGCTFDPNLHQAMAQVPNDAEEPGIVVEELQPGFKIHDRLLRPAMVAVAAEQE